MEIRALSSETMPDWFRFFEEIGFTDHPAWKSCYCTHFHYPRDPAYVEADSRKKLYARWLIETGRMRGYLAYEDGGPVAWVNANDRSAYQSLQELDAPDESVFAITCFVVAPAWRRKGIASRLLDHVVEDARVRGFAFVEAYPKMKATTAFGMYQGPGEMYLRKGFEPAMNRKTRVLRLKVAE